MDAFTDFILQVLYPPNPIRPLDNVLTADQEIGRQLFNTTNCGIPACLDGNCPVLTCAGCHTVDPDGKPDNGFFGTSGFSSYDFQPQLFKIPHLRNMYQKVGMFGHPPDIGFPGVDTSFMGDQVRGYGFLNDGNMDTMFRFHHGPSFSEDVTGDGNGGFESGPAGEIQRRQVESFLLAFPTNLASIVGQQITLAAPTSNTVVGRVDLLIQRANAGDCELVAKTQSSGVEAGYLYIGAGMFASDRRAQPPITDAALRTMATHGRPVTYTCVPPGSGERIGVDRDGDGAWDGDERVASTDPADPTSHP